MPSFEIEASEMHDAGAYARCSKCGTYCLDWAAIGLGGAAQPACCGCGERNYWTGSFEPPGPGSKFHPADASPYDVEGTDFPVCPFCGTMDQSYWDGLEPKSDGDTWEMDCPECDRPYMITMQVSTTFESEKPRPPEGKTIHRCCADPRYFERMPDADLRLAMSDTLKTCTLAELRAKLQEDSTTGIVYPVGEPCEGFDSKTGCPGHQVDP